MAFVYRAERNMNFSTNENNDTYPGEYFNNSSMIKDVDKQSSEFQSNSVRKLMTIGKNNDTPGPGSYEKSNSYMYDIHDFRQRAKSKDIYEAVKNNLMSKEIIKFLEKNQGIAFNTRGDRFNYSIDALEKKSKLPGPGTYSPNGSSINNANTDCSSILNQNSSKRTIEFSKNFPTTYSIYRTETIPSKGNLGYEFDKSGKQKMISNNAEKYPKEDKENHLLGPGYYNININNWNKNSIKWGKTQDEKDPKYAMIKYQKNLHPLTELEQDFLESKNKQKKDKKNKTMTNLKMRNEQNEKNAMFKYIMNQRYNMIKTMMEKREGEKDLIFEATPGPGYYAPENNKIFSEVEYMTVPNNKNNCFQSTSPRFKQESINDMDNKIGPGFYFQKTKPKIVKKDKLIKGHMENKDTKNINSSALKISLMKEEFNIPGPGTYELRGGLIPKISSTNSNFGFNDRRFKLNSDLVNSPGPGSYNGYKDQFTRTTHSLPKNSYKSDKVFTNSKSDLVNVSELNKIEREKFTVPPIGLYNPNIISSIGYQTKSKINTFVDEKLVGFGSQEKKTFSFISKNENKFLGPGIYHKNQQKSVKQNNAPFNQNKKRFIYNEDNEVPGPGSYELNSVDDWNKKSHNILFV